MLGLGLLLSVAGVGGGGSPPAPTPGQPLIVKDQEGDAGTNTKTITANTSQTIDGGVTTTITVNGGSKTLRYDGVSDWMVT